MEMKLKNSSRSSKARVMIVDDHPIVRYGVAKMLNSEPDLTICGEAEDGNSVLEAVERLKPAIVLMDISLKGSDGLSLTRIIRNRHPNIPVLILSMHDEKIYARKALRSGASGYIMKEETSARLVTAVREVLAGGMYVSEDARNTVLQAYANRDTGQVSTVDRLSNRERQVFLLIGQCYTTRAIAGKLFVSTKTIDTHCARIKVKLGVENRARLLLVAAEWANSEGLVPSA
jgi:DNA-binding NarL/FixJ family response regulator